jgi:hypothetical protein
LALGDEAIKGASHRDTITGPSVRAVIRHAKAAPQNLMLSNIGPPAHRDKQVADEIVSFNRPENVMRPKIGVLYVGQLSIFVIV